MSRSTAASGIRRRRAQAVSPLDDAGNGTLFTLWVACLVWVVGIALAMGAAAVVARHRASAAADLAALAAADHALYGARTACAQARRVTDEMGVVLDACALEGAIADVSATVGLGPGSIGARGVTVRARAGPARHSAATVR